MYLEDHIPQALAMVSARDIPDEDFADAVLDLARLMAGVPPEEHPGTQ